MELPRKDRDRDQDKKWNHPHGEERGVGACEQQQNIVDADWAGDPGQSRDGSEKQEEERPELRTVQVRREPLDDVILHCPRAQGLDWIRIQPNAIRVQRHQDQIEQEGQRQRL